MSGDKYIIFNILIVYCLKFSDSLVELPPTVDNSIVKTEAMIRHSFNEIFHHLKLSRVKENSTLQDYVTIHKYFASLTLQDYETLKQIVRLVKVDHKYKNSTDFISIINDLFDGDFDENKVNNNDEAVVMYVDNFLKVLKRLKEDYSVNKLYVRINTDILKLLKNNANLVNSSINNETMPIQSDEVDILDDNEFWEPSGRRIFKGKRTKIKHFPFMATIQIFNNFHCAGSIIKSDLIITASSCLQLAWNNRLFRENPAFLSARVGSSFYSGGGEVIPILEIYFHPDYNPKTLRNNVCVLRLSRHLNFRKRSKRIKKIDFDRQPNTLAVTTEGITILGWGAKGHSPIVGNPWQNILSFSVLDVYPLEECQDLYSREYVTKKNFCAGFFSRGGGACNHDVGGPGIVDGKLMGVISFGSPTCGTPDAPTVFVKLGYYVDWIEEIMEMDVPVSKKRTTLKPKIDPFTRPPSFTPKKPTTFKIQPLSGEKMTAIPISVIDNQLRILDEKVFKDFLDTMFNSKEADEYLDLLRDVKTKNISKAQNDKESRSSKVTEKYEPVTEMQEIDEPRTKITDADVNSIDVDEDTTEYTDKTFTTMANADDAEIDKQLEDLIDDVSLKEIIKEEMTVRPTTNMAVELDTTKAKQSNKHKNESILTLLYLSDEENRDNVKVIPIDKFDFERDDNDNEGLSIPDNNFADLTRARDGIVKIAPESELYGLLSEVLGEEVNNIAVNSL